MTPNEMLLVLAENEANATDDHDWNDETGVRYHFPNKYKNFVVPGAKFVYYKGSRRATGGRTDPVYFGTGVIGDVYLDPATDSAEAKDRKWLADIADYQRFKSAVPFRQKDGSYSELLSSSAAKNRWGTGVRRITPEAFDFLVSEGGLADQDVTSATKPATSGKPTSATLDALWKAKKPSKDQEASRKSFDYRRLSRRTKAIGDEAERVFLEWLRSREPDEEKRAAIRWVAQDGETPGYDIADSRGELHAYEVKGTTASQFVSLDMTVNELECAKKMGIHFSLALVAGVFTSAPRVTVLNNPAAALANGTLRATATAFRIDLLAPRSGADGA
jgi:hypothetical protein